jgi:hypothetical protein
MNGISGRTAKSLLGVVALMALLVAVAASSRGQEQISKRGIVTPLASANLVFDGEPACLKVARENGDPDKGASTFLLEAPLGCVVPAHYHTAEEQLMVVQGDVLTGMDGMEEATQGMLGIILRSRLLQDSVSGGHRYSRIVREARIGVKPMDPTNPTTFVADEIGRLRSLLCN